MKQIFKENWEDFVKEHQAIRPSIHKNVEKMLLCGTEEAGFHVYKCSSCGEEKKVAHTCKSRFCPSCGVAQTDIWIERYTTLFANCQYQHVIFSIPSEFRVYFSIGRTPYFNALYDVVKQSLTDWCNLKGYIPGGMSVLHTFGRDTKFHVHIHVLITCGGLAKNHERWIVSNYLPHDYLKVRFKRYFIEAIKQVWAEQNLHTVPKHLLYFFNYSYQKAIIAKLEKVTWYVHIGERLSNAQFVVRYIGRYTKRPAIAEARILAYDRKEKTVTFSFKEHRMTGKAILTLPVNEFIGKVIRHIPDAHFRIIRYFGFYTNRVRGILLPKVFMLLGLNFEKAKEHLTRLGSWWREKMKKATGLDPLTCPDCLIPLRLISIMYTKNSYG